MSAPTKAEMLEDWMANNDVTDDVLLDVLFSHYEADWEEDHNLGPLEDLREMVRDSIAGKLGR